MTWYWWIVAALLAVSVGGMALGFAAFVISGDDRYQAVSRRCRHWSLVIALAAFNIAVLKHIILWVLD